MMTTTLCAVLMPAVLPVGAFSIAWDTGQLALDETGRVAALTGAPWGGPSLAVAGTPLCQIETDKGTLLPTSAKLDGDALEVGFDGGVALRFRVTPGHGHALFELTELRGLEPASVRTLSLCVLAIEGLSRTGGVIGACYSDDFAVAVMGTHINVRQTVEGPSGANGTVTLRADTVAEHGIQPAGFGLIAIPKDQLPAAIEALELAAGLPSPHPGGVWSKLSPYTKESYLFITGMHESEVDLVIEWAKRGGFTTVLIGGDWSRTHGHHEINTAEYPDGLPSLQRAARKLKDAGLRVGLHFLGAAVYLDDAYVTPVPDDRLVVDARLTLAADVDAAADFIPTTEPPSSFAAEDGGYMGKGLYVRIGDEIIQYTSLKLDEPYGLTGCQRGALGTQAAAHAAGGEVGHLFRSYGYFLYDLDSTLAEEVIGNVCRVANAIEADMLYFDGSELLQGDHWYYNAKLQSMYYERLNNKDTFLQGSSYSSYSWHLISRTASADGHGDVKGYLDERTPAFAWYDANLMPLDIGWYYVYDPAVTADQFEYILQRCVGFNSSISVQTNPTQLRAHPEAGRIFDLVHLYDQLRHSGQVSDATQALLREPKREYRYLDDPPRLRRIQYGPWEDGPIAREEPLAGDGAVLGFDLRCGGLTRPGPAYESAEAVMLESFDDLAPYRNGPAEGPVTEVTTDAIGGCLPGVTQSLSLAPGEGPTGGTCGRYTATSTLPGPDGWSAAGRQFDPPLDLSFHQAIGFWLKGDGNGGAFKLQLQGGGATDYYITNDFTEWRYVQVLRPTEPQPSLVDYSQITGLMFYYNGLPGQTTATCLVDDVKALAAVDAAELRNPVLTVGDARVEVPITLSEGDRLLCIPGAPAEVIRPGTQERTRLDVFVGVPLAGPSQVTLSSAEAATGGMRVRLIQDLPEELALPRVAR